MEVVAAPSAGAVGSDGAASSAAASAELSAPDPPSAPQPEVVRAARPWTSVRELSDNEGDGDDDEKEKSRGKYRCGRCGAPKAGHVCPLESRSVRR